jgi:hypothetical protein
MVPSENPEDPDKTYSSWMNGHMYQIDLCMYPVCMYICTSTAGCVFLDPVLHLNMKVRINWWP